MQRKAKITYHNSHEIFVDKFWQLISVSFVIYSHDIGWYIFFLSDLDNQSQSISNDFDQQAVSKDKQKIRKAKKIDEITLPKINSVNIIKSKSNQETTKISSNYEVTEDTKEVDKQNEDKETKFGYFYAKPKAEIKRREEKNNLTKNLFSILADYNIRTSDQLPNYAISLRQNSRNSDHDYVYMQVPLRIPLSYNSLNHIPVDSLLAVFLSNYGQYLPGLYGFQRNYNNLYGYLASNNIHNNKPFGSYKIFSDTDTYQWH